MKITVLTLFPQYFSSVLQTSVLGKIIESGKVRVNLVNIREYAQDKHQVTDERPYGGGPGMVLKIDPIHKALQSLGLDKTTRPTPTGTKIVLTTADGTKFSQPVAQSWSKLEHLVMICGHYEAVDYRVEQLLVDETIRIGEFVLSGGEPAAAVIIDTVARLLPQALGNDASTQGESHSKHGWGAVPKYTRPESYLDTKVPEVLLSGNHAKIEEWQQKMRKQDV